MAKKTASPEVPIRIIKTANCTKLSGRGQLGYQIGIDPEEIIQLRLTSNDGGGRFNSNWVSLPVIEKLLVGHPTHKGMTSRVLHPIFIGRSTCSSAFLLACCIAEGLVTDGPTKESGCQLGDIEAFTKAMSVLIAAESNPRIATDAPPEPLKKKRPNKESE